MAVTVTDGTTDVLPRMVTGWRSRRRGGNVVHELVATENVDVTLRPAGLRRGTVEYLCDTLADALNLEALHAGEVVLSVAFSDAPALDMDYVVDGDVAVEIDDATRDAWLVLVDFQQVPA